MVLLKELLESEDDAKTENTIGRKMKMDKNSPEYQEYLKKQEFDMQKLKIDEKQAVLRAEAKRATKAGDLAGRDEYWAGYHRGRAKAYREAASLLGGKKLPVKRPEYYGNVK